MEIIITWGKGEGNTLLSAFDSALIDAGIGNFNLIPLSSVIPPKSSIRLKKKPFKENFKYGHRAYLVIAQNCSEKKQESIYAGLGWFLDKEQKGIFVEHSSHSKKEIQNLINNSLKDTALFRKQKNVKFNQKIIGMRVKDKPACVLVGAIYLLEEWKT